MKTTDSLRKAIVVLLDCKTEARAKKCAERIDTIINQIDVEFERLLDIFSQVEIVAEEE
jgi:hypothetical protein